MSALVLSALIGPIARSAPAQAAPITVTILRRTAVKMNPSYAAPTMGFLNPTTFEVTQLRVDEGFVRLLLRQIDRRWPARGYGYIAAADVAVDSGATEPARARTDTAPRAGTIVAAPSRPDTVAPARPAPTVPAPSATLPTPAARAESAPRVSTMPRTTELVVRPDAPPPPPSAVDSPDLSFLKKGPLAAIVQRPMSYRIGNTRDSITVPAGFVAEFASVPRVIWTVLSPAGAHQRAAIVHDYLYWFQPCEREETDNLLMIAMKDGGVSDLRRGAVYAGVRLASGDVWNANRAARDRGDLRIVPTQVGPRAQESRSEYRARLGRADIRGTPGRMPRQGYCDQVEPGAN